jgi:hypothetical protein
MATHTVGLPSYKCPLCGKQLANQEYRAALEELKVKVSEKYEEEIKTNKNEFEQKFRQMEEAHNSELEKSGTEHERRHLALEKELKEAYNKQLAIIKKNYASLSKQNQSQLKALRKQLKISYEKQLKEKGTEISELKKEQARFRRLASEEARAASQTEVDKLKNDIKERDIQISRFRQEVEGLKQQVTRSQSELKGEAGEIDLYSEITNAFPQDFIRRQQRGTSSGDLMQQIRTPTGQALETMIVYDNKEVSQVTKHDIEKARNYRKIHGTSYVIIVSSNLPKKDVKNGLYGEKEGILLVHPSIILEVAKHIRNSIIEISKYSKSRKDKESKESKLYEYVRSTEFSNSMEEFGLIYRKLVDLQSKEERDHRVVWNTRKELSNHLKNTHIDIASGIDSILQDIPASEVTSERVAETTPIREQ